MIWRALLIKANTGGDRFDERQNVWAVDENIALAHASVEKDGSDLRAVAIDMKTGEQLWDTPDWFPLAFAGDQVIAVSSSALPEQTNDTSVADGTVGALDRKTGKPRWDLGDQFDQSKLNVAAGDVAVVRGSSAGKVRQVLVNTADGEVRDDFGSVDDRPA